MALSLLQSAVTIAIASFSFASIATLSTAAPPTLGVVRQGVSEDLSRVIGKSFKFVGSTGKGLCGKSYTLKRTIPFEKSAFGKVISSQPGLSSFAESVKKTWKVVKYSDISVGGSDCSGPGEVIIVTRKGLRAYASFGAALGGGDTSAADQAIKNTSILAVAFDQNPGKCGGTTLPSEYGWFDDFDRTRPGIAKAVGVKGKKGDLFLVTTAAAREGITLFEKEDTACVYESKGGSSSGKSSTSKKEPSSKKEDEDAGEEQGKAGEEQGKASEEQGKASEEQGSGENQENNNNSCFPADALVSLESGETKRMDHLQIGDSVMVGVGEYSKVFMFTHKVADGANTFVTLKTASGASLSLTGGHYIYADDALVPARDVRVGSSVVLASGSVDRVVVIGSTPGTGLYNPQTVKGDIVVNGILASTYTTAVEPRFAHAVLAPFRWMNLLGLQCTVFESGGGLLGNAAPRGGMSL